MIKIFVTVLITLAVYLGITVSISYILNHREGIELDEFHLLDPSKDVVESVHLPYFEKLDQPATRILTTKIHSGKSKTLFLMIPRSSFHGFDILLNERLVFSMGDCEHFGNLWTRPFLVPLDLKDGENYLSIRLRALYDLRIKQPLLIMEKPDWLGYGLELILCEGSSVFASGSLLIMGVMLIVLFIKMKPWIGPYLTFGLSFLFMALYMMNLWYIPPVMSAKTFLLLKRFLFASSYMATGLYSVGVCQLAGKRSIGKISLAVGLVLFTIIMTIPDFWTTRELHKLTFVVPLAFLMISSIVLIKSRESELISPAVFITVVAFHHSVMVLRGSPSPTILGLGEIYFVFAFSIYLIKEFEKIRMRLQELEFESLLDPLTGAYNRRVLRDISVSGNDSLVFFDIDDFKKLNDEMGHDHGDYVLKEFVRSIKQEIRSSDVIVRYGGDEFVVILKNCSNKEARRIAKRIANSFKEKTNLTVSFGVSSIVVGLPKALEFADKKMYQMKSSRKLS